MRLSIETKIFLVFLAFGLAVICFGVVPMVKNFTADPFGCVEDRIYAAENNAPAVECDTNPFVGK